MNRYCKLDLQTTATVTTFTDLRKTATAFAKIAQDWTSGVTGKFTGATIAIRKVGAPTGTCTLKIYAANAVPEGGALLATSDTFDVSTLTTSAVQRAFYFTSAPFAITAATQYYVVLEGTFAVSATDYVQVCGSAASAYAGGTLWTHNNTSWSAVANNDMSLSVFTNADGGFFDLDTSVATSVLRTTVKGAAIAATDEICYYNGITVTQDEALTCLITRMGKSVGATGTTVADATSGQRSGIWDNTAGWPTTFAGNATNTNSGHSSALTAADATSKNGILKILTATTPLATRATVTNLGNALDTNQKWTINWPNGQVKIYNIDALYSYTTPFNAIAMDSSKTVGGPVIKNGTYGGFIAGALNLIALPSGVSIDLACDFRLNSIDLTGLVMGASAFTYITRVLASTLTTGGSIARGGVKILPPASGTGGITLLTIMHPASGALYDNGDVLSFADIRQTQIVPTGLVLTNLQNGTAKIEVSNIASVSANDELCLFLADGTPLYKVSRAKYEAALGEKAANSGLVASLQIGTTYSGIYAKYTSDLSTYGNASAAAADVTVTYTPGVADARPIGYGQGGNKYTGTLDNLLATDGAYVTLEATRNNILTFAIGKLKSAIQIMLKGTTYTGTRTDAAAGNVIAGSGTYGADGTEFTPSSDKLYSASEEAARNVVLDQGLALAGQTWKQLGANKTGTLAIILGLDMPRVPLAGAVEVTAFGYGFTGKTQVKIGGSGGTLATGLNVVSDYVMKFTVPAKAEGAYDIYASGGAFDAINQGPMIEYIDTGVPAPDAPTGLDCTDVRSTSFTLIWDAGLNVSSWDVYKDGVLFGNSLTNSLSITGLAGSTAYVMTVIAKNSSSSPASEPKTVTTAAPEAGSLSLLGTQVLASVVSFGGACNVMSLQTGKIFDLRLYPSALPHDTQEYYYKDVVNNNGGVVIPK